MDSFTSHFEQTWPQCPPWPIPEDGRRKRRDAEDAEKTDRETARSFEQPATAGLSNFREE